jgi:hypothetical protein
MSGRFRLDRLRSKGSRSVTLGPLRPGQLALASELLDALFLIVRARQRHEESNQVVDLFLGEAERLDISVEIGVLQSVALIVVVQYYAIAS